MKHILLVHQAFVSPNQAGGTRHFEFARLLEPSAKYAFTIIASTLSYLTGKKAADEDRNALPASLTIECAYTLPVSHRSFVWRVVAFFSFMVTSVWTSRKVKRVDLVMGTTPPIFQAVSAWLISFLRRKPFLLEVRDLWPEFAIDMGVLRNPVLIWLSRLLESFLYHRATHILVNSPAYRDYLLERGLPARKISLIANGVDPDMFMVDADGHEFRERYSLAGRFVVTYAGALGPANDIQTIVAAARLLRDVTDLTILLVGDGKERVALEALCREQELDYVLFTGALPKADIPMLLAASDVCVATLMNIPMFRTTYPNKVFDYMAAARPTVLAIDGVIREVLEASGGGLYVEPGSPDALASGIRWLREHPVQAHAMGQAARAYVIEHFNRQTQVADFGRLIDQLT